MSKRQWYELIIMVLTVMICVLCSYIVAVGVALAIEKQHPIVAFAECYCLAAGWFMFPTMALIRWANRLANWIGAKLSK